MKQPKMFTAATLALFLTACSANQISPTPSNPGKPVDHFVEIEFHDNEILVNGETAGKVEKNAVYTANDIVYYEAGKDFTYGEGTEEDAHSAQVAEEHTVVHITQAGTYRISGTLSKGQIAVDLGKDAEENPEAVVTLILNGIDITCETAPAIIFYNVYECGSSEPEGASKDVDTSAAGANIIIADGTTNKVNGSYVARIYKPDSIVLNAAGTEVEDAKKLHKYDGALYSKMSMNVTGGEKNTGVLIINAENEGLDSELHLTINGGIIYINSGNDGVNTNEDGVSVTTVNGGELHIKVTGDTGEGDGIDSNGWLVINGGTVTAQACSSSADAGIDSDMGIHINGGKVIASGHMLDQIEAGGQNYAVFSFAKEQSGGNTITLNNKNGSPVMEFCPENSYSILVYSSPDLTADTYTLWQDETQLSNQRGMMDGPGMQGMHGMKPDGTDFSQRPEGQMPGESMPQRPEGMAPPQGDHPLDGKNPPEGMAPPEGFSPDKQPGSQWHPGSGHEDFSGETSTEFQISNGGNMFQNIS